MLVTAYKLSVKFGNVKNPLEICLTNQQLQHVMKTISKAQLAKIQEITILSAELQYELVTTYDGGTWPYVVDIQSIKVSKTGQFVTIDGGEGRSQFINKERFNVNDCDEWSGNGVKALNRTLNVILKAYKNHK